MTIWDNLVVTAVLVAALMFSAWLVGVRRIRHDGVDTMWGAGFVLIALTTYALSDHSGDRAIRVLVTAMTVLWGMRLAVHIHRRNACQPPDRRYMALMRQVRGNPAAYALYQIYLRQAAAMWIVSLPVQVAQYAGGHIDVVVTCGVLLWLSGFAFETIGDAQLVRFRADPANRDRVLNTGLWRYTRHPNYFGEACMWWGIYIVACDGWSGVLALISPLLMTALLARITGGPLLERTIQTRRPAYTDYMAHTSPFIPWPPSRCRPNSKTCLADMRVDDIRDGRS